VTPITSVPPVAVEADSDALGVVEQPDTTRANAIAKPAEAVNPRRAWLPGIMGGLLNARCPAVERERAPGG
jgi:hypothetical protein